MTSPPRIAIDYTPALEQGGGIGRYVRELIQALAALDQNTPYRLFAAGYDQEALPPPPGPNFTWRPARLSTAWFARLWHRARLPLPVEQWVGDVALYHATDFTLPPVRSHTRTLLTVHDLSFVRTPETAAPGLRNYLNRVVPRSVRRADHILADSEATRQDLIDLYDTLPNKVSVLYSGVSQHFQPVEDAADLRAMRQKYAIDARPYILSVGTVQPRKNYGRLAAALHQLPRDDIQLVIAGGKGWLDDHLYEDIEQLGLADRVQFIGFVDDADLPALYSAAEVMAFLSLYEGFGLPVLEAMACHTPVVASNVSSIPEVVGKAGLLVDPTNVEAIATALSTLLNDNRLADNLRQKGQQQVQYFTWERAARQLRQHYHTLLA